MPHTGLIVLAAGASTRLGSPKQLLPYQNSSLLKVSVEKAIASACQPIAVVLGAYAEKIQPEIAGLPVQVVQNDEWATGMGTSVQCGLSCLEAQTPDLDAVVLLVCDQPFVSAPLINRLIATHRKTGKAIVASAYADTVGVPALFSRRLFPALRSLTEKGAKSIMNRYADRVASVSFAKGKIDIDTPTDAEKWLSPDQKKHIPADALALGATGKA